MNINVDNRDIYFSKSEDDSIHISYYLKKNDENSLVVDNKILTLKVDSKYLFVINIGMIDWFIDPIYRNVLIELPETVYNLDITTTNGMLKLEESKLNQVKLKISKGPIVIKNIVSNNLNATTSNGKIEMINT